MKKLLSILMIYSLLTGYAIAQSNLVNQGILISGSTAQAQSEIVFNKNQPTRLNFDFGGSKAWLNHQGDWGIEGIVKHTRLKCATYQVAIRFGKGDKACTNVVWLTKYQNGTYKKQCNSAPAKHTGGGNMYELENQVTNVTCAQIKINCSGQCEK